MSQQVIAHILTDSERSVLVSALKGKPIQVTDLPIVVPLIEGLERAGEIVLR